MIKTVNGKTYESVPEPENAITIEEKCATCCADNDGWLCIALSQCAAAKIVWKEVVEKGGQQ